MSKRTRTHRPTTASLRYTKAHGIGQDRVRWPSGKFRMPFRHLPDTPAPAIEVEGQLEPAADDG